jgi:inner membrane protein
MVLLAIGIAYPQFDITMMLLEFVIILVLSLPILIALSILLPVIVNRMPGPTAFFISYCFFSFICAIPYRIIFESFEHFSFCSNDIHPVFVFWFFAMVAGAVRYAGFNAYFKRHRPDLFSYNSNNNNYNMEPINYPQPEQGSGNPLLFKGIITGVLILVMLIPTLFINNLIKERKQRQEQVVKEVTSKWSDQQTIFTPFLVIPKIEHKTDENGKPITIRTHLTVLSSNAYIKSIIHPEIRPRSIYKVLLYHSNNDIKGSFQPEWPESLDTNALDFNETRLCFGLSDYRGIEQEISVQLNGSNYILKPGLPANALNIQGLSVRIPMTKEVLEKGLAFSVNAKIKGSEAVYFQPMSMNSTIQMSSSWPNPSFDGNILPSKREISKDGFVSEWNFNSANQPFGNVIETSQTSLKGLQCGVSMVQPADQYNKTERSVKYALLFIGFTFAIFFIVEILQKNPLHPVQYVLVGIGLVIFYTLLLAISEYIAFDYAYLVAALGTTTLIGTYAGAHFKSVGSGFLFGGMLAALYGFTFVLIRLEDTALIVGSVGLFIILAIVMYLSRKVKWYGTRSQNL